MPASAAERQAFAAELNRLVDVEKVKTQAELARAIEVSPQQVSKYMKGTDTPGSRDTAEKIDHALKADGAILAALGYADVTNWRADIERRLAAIEAHVFADADVIELPSAADTGRAGKRGRRVNRPSPEPEPEGP